MKPPEEWTDEDIIEYMAIAGELTAFFQKLEEIDSTFVNYPWEHMEFITCKLEIRKDDE